MTWWEKEVAPKSRVIVPVSKLSFDFENPRFTPEKRPDGNSDAAIIAQLASSADLGELVQSISASGYVDIEPLIVIGRGDKLVVLEGNRRLAAIRVLSDPKLATVARVSTPDLPDEIRQTLVSVSVYRVEEEAEARDLIGFKHINGPQVWDAYAKARYAAKWLDIERSKRDSGENGLTISEIAHRMGDKHDTIHRIVTAAYVLDQAEAEKLYDVTDRIPKNFSFSHLYTALSYVEYRDFLGMPPLDRNNDPIRNPILPNNSDNLRRLLLWLYGSRSEDFEPAIRRQNPDLARLKRVLSDPRARHVMLERNNLDEAVDSTVSSADRFEKSLIDADESLKRAQGSIDGYDGADESLLEIGQSIADKGKIIHRHMTVAREELISKDRKDDG